MPPIVSSIRKSITVGADCEFILCIDTYASNDETHHECQSIHTANGNELRYFLFIRFVRLCDLKRIFIERDNSMSLHSEQRKYAENILSHWANVKITQYFEKFTHVSGSHSE